MTRNKIYVIWGIGPDVPPQIAAHAELHETLAGTLISVTEIIFDDDRSRAIKFPLDKPATVNCRTENLQQFN